VITHNPALAHVRQGFYAQPVDKTRRQGVLSLNGKSYVFGAWVQWEHFTGCWLTPATSDTNSLLPAGCDVA